MQMPQLSRFHLSEVESSPPPPRNSRRASQNSKSQVVFVESTQNQSLHEDLGARNRHIMKSMQIVPDHFEPQSNPHHLYSQPDEELHTQYEGETNPPGRHRDAFGQPRRMRESSSSYRFASSSSSQQQRSYRNSQRVSRTSAKSRKSGGSVERAEWKQQSVSYYSSMGVSYQIDEEIYEDIKRYYG